MSQQRNNKMELLRVDSLKKYFGSKKTFKGSHNLLRAVDGIDFSIQEDSVLSLVGESGCGKSTVARLVLRLINPTSGSVLFRGHNVFSLDRDSLKSFRKSVQIIFQDPFASLNPRRTVYDTISEPLIIHKIVPRSQMKDTVEEIMGKVGLRPEVLTRYPHEFSGGQRQRVCIARALAVSPAIIVADEPLSALDVSIQAQILNLLLDLKRRLKISFLFISHDLRVVHYFSDIVGVMYLGKIVEYAKTEDLFENPLHPYTSVLFDSVPKIKGRNELQDFGEPFGPSGSTELAEVSGRGLSRAVRSDKLKDTNKGKDSSLKFDLGEVPSPINIPPGCPFHPRCPRRFNPCNKIAPQLKESQGRLVSCHLCNPY